MEEQIDNCYLALKDILNTHGCEVFQLAVETLANTHPDFKANNPLLQWELLLLPKGCDYDAILEVADRTAIANHRQTLETLI